MSTNITVLSSDEGDSPGPRQDRHSHAGKENPRRRSHSPDEKYPRKKAHIQREDSLDAHFDCKRRQRKLQERYETLLSKYSDLKSAHKALVENHNTLVSAIGDRLSQSTSGPSSHKIPERAQPQPNPIPERFLGITRQNASSRFPDVKFWTQSDFTKFQKAEKKNSDVLTINQPATLRGNARLKEGQNVTMRYAEQEDGTIIGGVEAEAVRAHLRTIFNGVKEQLPKTWTGIGSADKSYILGELYKAYPYLLLCFDDWKGDYLASRTLSTYQSTLKKRADCDVKTKGDDEIPSVGKLKQEKRSKEKPNATSSTEPGFPSSNPSTNTTPSASSEPLSTPVPVTQVMTPSTPEVQTSPALMPALSPEIPATPFSTGHVPPTSLPAAVSEGVVSPTSLPTAISEGVVSPPSSPADKRAESTVTYDTTEAESARDGITASMTSPTPENATENGPELVEDNSASDEGAPQEQIPNNSVRKRTLRAGNPLTKAFGPPSAPSRRLENLRQPQTRSTHAVAGSMLATSNNPDVLTSPSQDDGRAAEEEPQVEAPEIEDAQATATDGPLKKTTSSYAPKNMYYKEYLKTHSGLTIKAFEERWNSLPKDEIKRWNKLSKEAKVAEAAVGVLDNNDD